MQDNNIFIMIFFIIILFLANFLFIFFHKNISEFINVYDTPDKTRKFHTNRTAISGGLLIIGNILVYSFFYSLIEEFKNLFFIGFDDYLIFLVTCFLIFLLGFYDDNKNLSPNKKFIFLLMIILPGIFFIDNLTIKTISLSFIDNKINLYAFSSIWTLLCFLLFVNAINMFDGINLQLSIYFIFLLLVLFIIIGFDLLLLTIFLSLISFSFLNKKSKSFLGDGGSLVLAYIFGSFFIILHNKQDLIFADQIVLIMIIPGIELMRLFFLRIINKKNPFSPDRNHLHHLLMERLNFTKTTIIIQLLIIGPIILNLVFGYTIPILLISLLIYFLVVKKFS